jgi:sugar lactone lactonase YvrE
MVFQDGSAIYKVGAGGKPVLFRDDSGGATGLMFGADGRLYAAEDKRKRVVAYSSGGKLTVLEDGTQPHDLAVTPAGAVYFTESAARKVWRIAPDGKRSVVFDAIHDGNIMMPNGVRLSPDHGLLIVADTVGRDSWPFRIQPDGSLGDGQPF